MEETNTYKIIDSQGNEVLTDISISFLDFINNVDDMRQLYRLSRYTQAEEMRDELFEKLDAVMCEGYY